MKYFIYGFLAVLPLSLLSDAAFSAETRPYMYRTLQTAQLQSLLNSSSPSVPVLFETVATTPTNQQVTRYTTRNVPVSKARLGSIARSAVGGPVVLAATAAWVAYDYFYDEDTDTWTTQPTVVDDDVAPSGFAFCTINQTSCSSTRYGLLQKERARYGYPDNPQCVYLISTDGGAGYGQMYIRNTSGSSCTGGVLGANIYRPSAPVGFVPDGPYVESGTPLSDSDLGDAILNSPSLISDVLNDPISTGTWRDRWPELLPHVSDIEDQLGHDIEGAPAPSNPDQTITDGSTYNPPETDTGSSGSMSSEWPTFCSWAGIVCTFIDWVQEPFEEPAPVDIPYVEIDFEEDYDSGIGIPNCPAPISIVTQFGEVQFDWSNTCSLAEMIKPLVIAFSYLIGIYILLRVK